MMMNDSTINSERNITDISPAEARQSFPGHTPGGSGEAAWLFLASFWNKLPVVEREEIIRRALSGADDLALQAVVRLIDGVSGSNGEIACAEFQSYLAGR